MDEPRAVPTGSARVTKSLIKAASYFGLRAQREFKVPGGRVDVVWLWRSALPGVEGDLPIVAFEIESSWRTRKHIKGDLVNLQDACPLVAIIVLLGEGNDVESTRRFASRLVDRPGSRIVVWSEKDVEALLATAGSNETEAATLESADETAMVEAGGSDPVAQTQGCKEHRGKYRALWDWLRRQPLSPVGTTFTEIEDILRFPLPPSCRRHHPHWYGYDNTAVGRAIRDAGWRARFVNLDQETVVFERTGPMEE